MTDIIDHLLARALVGRRRSREDRRNYLITLTAAGRLLADRAETVFLHTLTEIASPLQEHAPRALLGLCDQLAPTASFPLRSPLP